MINDQFKTIDSPTVVLDVLTRLVRALARTMANQESGALTLPQYRLMKRLVTRSYLVGELASELEVTPATVSVAIDALVRRDLVERLTRSGDRRAVPIQLTPAGRAVLDAARIRQQETLDGILARLNESERQSLMIGLVALDHALDVTSEAEDTRNYG